MDDLPPGLRASVGSVGYQLGRWSAARDVLAARTAKRRWRDDLQVFLEEWAARHVPASLDATLGESTDGWKLLRGGLSEFPAERALLHLPALRRFWIQELRLPHFDALRRLVPAAWFLDDAPVPPGTVIAGLGITRWADLPLKDHASRFVIINRAGDERIVDTLALTGAMQAKHLVLVERVVPQRTFLARFLQNERGQTVLRDCEALS